MRNLKRALSLLLSSTLVLGMLVMGGSAAGYKDVDASNDHQEAIEVLQAVGIMTGDQNGNFNPDGSITRNEMAVIMAHLLNLDYDYYRGTNPFTDVPEWAAPYVAACAAEGVVAGIGNGQYGGSNKVTAAEASLMIMKALGYFQNAEDFGTDWQVATIRQASYINLFDRINATAESALTRAQVAQLVLNGLKSDMVSFTGDKGIQIGDVTVGYRAEYTPKTSSAAKYNAIVSGRTDIAPQGQYYIQLGEELYNGELKLANGSDMFERPSRVWSYKGSEVGTYAKKELIVESYTAGVSGKDLYNLLSSAVINDKEYSFDYYVDGVVDTTITKANMTRSNDDDYATTGNGVLTEVYLDNNAQELTIVSINTYLAQANDDYSEKKEYASLAVYEKNDTGVNFNVDVEDVPAVANVKDEAYYLVNISYKDSTKGEVVALQDAQVMSNSTVTKFSASSNGSGSGKVTSLTTDGTKYDAAQKSYYDADILDKYNNASLTDATYNVYLDQYGYFIGVDLYEGAKKYVFITGYDRPQSNLSVKTADAAGIFLDGTMEVIEVNVTDTDKNIGTTAGYTQWSKSAGNGGNYAENRWYSYTVSESGVYTLKPVAMTATEYTSETTIKTNNLIVNNMAMDFGADNDGVRVYGEDDSVYLTVEQGIVDTTKGQDLAITEVTGTYTGVQNVTLDVYKKADVNDHPSVYTVYDEDYYIIGAIVLGEAQGNKANIAYVLSQAKSEEKIGDTYYWEFDAIVNGEIQTLTAKSKYPSTIDILEGEMTGKIGTTSYTGIKDQLVELRYDGDYVTKINDVKSDDIYTTLAQAINGQDVYLATNLNNGDHALTLQGRTLYVDNQRRDYGLALTSDAKAITIQTENSKEVKTEFTSVSSAIANLYEGGKPYAGDIVAVLNSDGAAEWIVFISDNPVNTGSNKPNPGDNDGDVRYSYVDVATRNIYLDKRDQDGATQEAIEVAAQKALASIGWQATGDMDTSTTPWSIKGVDMSSSNPAEVTFKITFEK